MPAIAVSRKRTSGPGFNSNQVEIGRQKVWSKMSGSYVIDAPIMASPNNGFYKVTWDNIHKEFVKRGAKITRSKRRYADDLGGDFSSLEASDEGFVRGVGHYACEDGYSKTTYDGGFVPYSQHQYPGISTADLTGMGDTGRYSGGFGLASTAEGVQAWKRFRPKLYVADMGQFVGEIRETLPMLRTSASMFSRQFLDVFGTSMRHQKVMSKTISNHWLNAQFGWAPFVSDLTKFLTKFRSVDQRLQQCIRDNGKDIRRRGVLGSTMAGSGDVEVVTSNGIPGWDTIYVQPFSLYNGLINPYSGHVKSTMIRTIKYQTWFSACFRYWVPSFESNDFALERALNYMRMFGLRITPSLVYNLTPWSWMADWFGNVGDNIDNYTASQDDNLTAKYAYIMKTITEEVINDSYIKCGGTEVSGLRWRRGVVAKTRVQASQFGFSITMPEFSTWQWSILAALGFSRLNIESRRR